MKKTLILFLVLGLRVLSPAQRPGALPDLRPLLDSVDILRQQEHITGLMLGITTADSVLFTGGFGYADVNAHRPADAQTLFRMGSITKMFVSIGILQLVAEGRLHLNDEIKKIAPEVPFQNRWEATNPLRIVHLLEHTSGFDDIQLNRMYAADGHENRGIEQMLVHRPSLITRWKPGERVAYSNPNYAVLGYLIEKLSGQPWEAYLTDHILLPLGMRQSNFNLGSKFPQQDTREYIFRDGRPQLVPSPTLLSGASGALWSSAADMARFVQMLLRNGAPVLTPEGLAEMETAHSSLAARSGLKSAYALANRPGIFLGKYPFRGHEGLTGACFSSLNYNRELGVGFVLSSNTNQPIGKIADLIARYLSEHLPAPPGYQPLAVLPLDTVAIRPYLGMYQMESPRNAISGFRDRLTDAPRISLLGGRLYFKPLVGEAVELLQTGPLTFAWPGMNTPLVVFARNDSGRPVLLIGGVYYEQVDARLAMLKRILLLLAIFLAVASIPAGLFNLLRAIRSRTTWRHRAPRLLPMTGIAALSWAIGNLMTVEQETFRLAELAAMNARTLGVFLGTSAFGILSVLSLVLFVRQFRGTSPRWVAWYWLLTAVGLCAIAGILAQHGWIGLRTWAL